MEIGQATGQTCNQFWFYSNFFSEAFNKNENFAICVPGIAFEYYPDLLNSEFISYPFYYKRLATFLGYWNYIKGIKTDLKISTQFFLLI